MKVFLSNLNSDLKFLKINFVAFNCSLIKYLVELLFNKVMNNKASALLLNVLEAFGNSSSTNQVVVGGSAYTNFSAVLVGALS